MDEVTTNEPTMPTVSTDERINKALEIAWQFAQIDGGHHKAWTIDRMVRALCGDEETYKKWVAEYTEPFVDEDGDDNWYDWDEGIAP